MPDLLIRDIDAKTIIRLKKRAKNANRSLQAELHEILNRAAKQDVVEFAKVAARVRRELSGRRHSDSAALIADDRLSR